MEQRSAHRTEKGGKSVTWKLDQDSGAVHAEVECDGKNARCRVRVSLMARVVSRPIR
jgi:hypothetical protein